MNARIAVFSAALAACLGLSGAAYAGGSGAGANFERDPDHGNKWEAWKKRERDADPARRAMTAHPPKKTPAPM